LALILVPGYGIIGMAWASLLAAVLYATAIVAANRSSAQAVGKALPLDAAARASRGQE
jgi:hypothetical protein